eukprot:1057408-Pyramimonas_sp.AAC.1
MRPRHQCRHTSNSLRGSMGNSAEGPSGAVRMRFHAHGMSMSAHPFHTLHSPIENPTGRPNDRVHMRPPAHR